jgi:nucleotidyltransferase/DNA polymerase involved in DNA repair
MATTLPVKISFSLPDGWQAAPPDEVGAPGAAFVALHPLSIDEGFTANITISGRMRNDSATMWDIAGESVQRLERAGTVEVVKKAELGTPDIPGLTDSPGVLQNLRLSTTLRGEPLELLQSQVYLGMEDVKNPAKRAVIELVLTAKPTQLGDVIEDFQEFLRTVRPAEETAA